MKLEIKRIHFKGIRDFRDLQIDLQNHKHISLLQMPNGTGKTTTMALLRAALSGKFSGVVADYRPTLFEANQGEFRLDVAIDGTTYTVLLHLNYGDGSHEFSTVRVQRIGGGREAGHHLPKSARHVLTDAFCRLFVFDGELSKGLLDKRQTRAESAIKNLYLLDRLDEVSKLRIDAEISERLKKAEKSGVTKEQGLKQRISLHAGLIDTKRGLLDDQKTLEGKIADESALLDQKKKQQDILVKDNKDFAKQTGENEAALRENQIALKAKTKDVMTRLSFPSHFSEHAYHSLTALGERMTRLKLPKTTAIEFFKELADGTECVCGHEMTSEMKKHILETSEKYLAQERVLVMNAIKSDIKGLGPYEGSDDEIKSLRELQGAQNDLIQEQARLLEIMPEDQQSVLAALDKEIKDLERDLEDQRLALEALTTADATAQKDYGMTERTNIPLCDKAIEKVSGEINEAAGTVTFQRQANKLKAILEEVVRVSITRVKTTLISQTNERLSKVLGFSQLVEIKDIDHAIVLEQKGDVSEGQKLSLAYCFLSTLFENGPMEVPFIVDSPAGSLDLAVRREVATLIPGLFNQLVVFIISSEKPGFVSGLRKEYDSIDYLTVHKRADDPSQIELSAEYAYFDAFQSEDDE